MLYCEALTDQQFVLINETIGECISILRHTGYQNPLQNNDVRLTLSSRMSRTLGKVVFRRKRGQLIKPEVQLVLQKDLVHPDFKKDLTEIVLHELIHILYPHENHGPLFQQACRIIERCYPQYHLSTTYKPEEHDYQPADEKNYRYILQCPKCGAQWHYQRMCDRVRHPYRYVCKRCQEELVRIK